jgi:hypothetical protein
MHTQNKIVRGVLCSLPNFPFTLPPSQSGWQVIVGAFPATDPDNCICVYNTSGYIDGFFQRTGEVIERPGVQIVARGRNYETAQDKLAQLMLGLDTFKPAIVTLPEDGVHYVVYSVTRTSSAFDLGEDPTRQRRLVAVNYLVTYRLQMVGDHF